MELARIVRHKRNRRSEQYLRKYAPAHFVPHKGGRAKASLATKRIVEEIVADQGSQVTIELQDYTHVLTTDILWELAHAVCDKARYVNLSGWRGMTTVALRSLSLGMGENLVGLNLSRSNAATDPLQFATIRFFALQSLDLSRCATVQDRTVGVIVDGCCHTLTSLNLSHCKSLTQDSLFWLGGQLGHPPKPCAKLTSLNLGYCTNIKDAGVVALSLGCGKLRFLSLAKCKLVGDKGVGAIGAGCPRLRVLNLDRLNTVTDGSVVQLANGCRRLRSLNLAGMFNLSDRSVTQLGRCLPKLQNLNLTGAIKVTEVGMYELAIGCPHLQVLNISGCERVTQKGLNHMITGRKFVRASTAFYGFEPVPAANEAKFAYQAQVVREACALRIQRVFRGHRGRKRFYSFHQARTEQDASITLTKWFRKHHNRHMSGDTKEGRHRGAAAIKIQTVMRMTLALRYVMSVRRFQKKIRDQSFAITRTKAMFRGMFTRKRHTEVLDAIRWMHEDRQVEAEQIVALRMQAIVRGRLSRLKFRASVEEAMRRRTDMHFSALLIQKNYRGVLGRRFAAEHKRKVLAWRKLCNDSAARLQRVWHGYQGRKFAKWYRANRDRIMWERHKAAVQIQRIMRGKIARRILNDLREEFKHQTRVATYLQAHWRKGLTTKWRQRKLNKIQGILEQRQKVAMARAKHSAHVTWRKLQQELAKDSCSEDSDEAVPSDEDWQEIWDDDLGHNIFFSPSRNTRTDYYIDVRAWEKTLVGKRCKIYWPEEEQWYEGRIVRYNARKGRHKVVHPDGDKDWIDMHSEHSRVQIFTDGGWAMYRIARPMDPLKAYALQKEKEAEAAKKAAEEAEAAAALEWEQQKALLADVWVDYFDEAFGSTYWYNAETGETSWSDPFQRPGPTDDGANDGMVTTYGYDEHGELVAAAGAAEYGGGLDAGAGAAVAAASQWLRTWSEDYECYYYYHSESGETSYEEPVDGFYDDKTGEYIAAGTAAA